MWHWSCLYHTYTNDFTKYKVTRKNMLLIYMKTCCKTFNHVNVLCFLYCEHHLWLIHLLACFGEEGVWEVISCFQFFGMLTKFQSITGKKRKEKNFLLFLVWFGFDFLIFCGLWLDWIWTLVIVWTWTLSICYTSTQWFFPDVLFAKVQRFGFLFMWVYSFGGFDFSFLFLFILLSFIT